MSSIEQQGRNDNVYVRSYSVRRAHSLMLHFAVTEMLGETKINHAQFGILVGAGKKKVLYTPN